MGSIFEDRSRRKRRHRSNRKHYVGFSDLFGPHRRKFVKTRRQAVIALFIILTIGILVIISSFSDHPSEQATLSGTYYGKATFLNDSWDIDLSNPTSSLTFDGDILTMVSLSNNYSDVYKYSLHNAIQNGESVTFISLTGAEYNVTISYPLERHGDCIRFSGQIACKSGSGNESTILVSNYLYLYTGIILVVLGLVPILFLVFRSRIFRRRKRLIESPKVRVNIPTATRQQVYARAGGRCERPRCSYHGKLNIHHIDENPSNNSPTNLVAVCPNCHTRIHDGEFSIDAQRSWITL